jgi:hypothetical protein
MGAILAANKRLLGYIIIAGVGVLTLLLFHSFGRQKYRIARYNIYKAELSARRAVYTTDMTDRNAAQKIINALKKKTI